MDTPTYNAEQQAVWKPQPGEYWEGGLRYAQSYGGIVSALQDIQASKGDKVKSYPNNFAGIIAAIEDLQISQIEGGLPNVGAPPPGWEIIINPDGSVDGGWQQPPADGTLWFDTRQGRLFIAIDEEWVQTNGGDGIAHVGPNPPINPPVIGQTWLDSVNGLFYVYIGEGQWQAVVSDGDITLTTATLPLAVARSTSTDLYEPQILPELPSIADMQVQKDYNTWIMSSLVSLDKAITEGSVSIGETPPTDNVVPGTLWYDSTTLELSIYYEDNDSKQWVPVSVGHAEIDIISRLQEELDAEISARTAAVDNLHSMLAEMSSVDDAAFDALSQKVKELDDNLGSLQIPDISHLVTKSEYSVAKTRLTDLENATIDFTPFATLVKLQEAKDSLTALIDAKSDLTIDDVLNNVLPLFPDISNKVEQSDIDASISAITNRFLSRNGGTIDGSFVVNKSDISQPAFDVSSSWWNSKDLFKLQSNSPNSSVTTFGATDEFWQYAWKFAGKEDFAWVHDDNGKVFSISKDGPACSQLYIGDFGINTQNGRVVTNTIEVGEELRKYNQVFTDIRAAVNFSTDFDSLKANLLQALSGL